MQWQPTVVLSLRFRRGNCKVACAYSYSTSFSLFQPASGKWSMEEWWLPSADNSFSPAFDVLHQTWDVGSLLFDFWGWHGPVKMVPTSSSTFNKSPTASGEATRQTTGLLGTQCVLSAPCGGGHFKTLPKSKQTQEKRWDICSLLGWDIFQLTKLFNQ